MDRGKLLDHPGPPWFVECVRQLFFSILQRLEDIQVTLVITSRGFPAKRFEFFKNALAEPLESYLPKFAEKLPV